MTIERPFLKTMPCDECLTVEDECYCGAYRVACEVAEYARESAAGIRGLRHITDQSRGELAAQTADAIDNALYDVGARLDDRAFLLACGVHVQKGVAQT
jgi:hypothetical protein